MSFPRSTLNMIARIKSHHVNSNEYLADKNIVDSPLCSCGAAIQNVEHIFFHCTNHTTENCKLKIDLFKAGIDPSLTITDIAFTNNEKAFKLLGAFLKDIGKIL